MKTRERSHFALLWGKKTFKNILGSFLSVTLFEEYTSGERSKEMHVSTYSKENEKILLLYKTKTCQHLKLKETLQDFLMTLKQENIKAI